MKFISVVHQYTFVQSSHTFRFQTLFQFTYAFFNSQTMSSIPVGGRIEYSTDLYDIYPSQPLKSRLFPAARMFFPTLPLKSRLFLAARMLFPTLPLKSRLFPAARMLFPILPLKSRLFLAARRMLKSRLFLATRRIMKSKLLLTRKMYL